MNVKEGANRMESLLGNYESEEKLNIVTSLTFLADKGWFGDSDPLQLHIIVGKKIRSQEAELITLNEKLKDCEEQTLQKEKYVKDHKSELQHEKEVNRALEEDLDLKVDEIINLKKDMQKKDNQIWHIKKDLRQKAEECDDLENLVNEKLEEIQYLKENILSFAKQLGEGSKLERRFSNLTVEFFLKLSDAKLVNMNLDHSGPNLATILC